MDALCPTGAAGRSTSSPPDSVLSVTQAGHISHFRLAFIIDTRSRDNQGAMHVRDGLDAELHLSPFFGKWNGEQPGDLD